LNYRRIDRDQWEYLVKTGNIPVGFQWLPKTKFVVGILGHCRIENCMKSALTSP